MSGFKQFQYSGKGGQITAKQARMNGKSVSERHPYLNPEFWRNPNNQFWRSELYSKKSKQYFINSLEV